MFVDFRELKTRVSIEQAVQILGLMMKPAGPQLRGMCPACNEGGDRALVVTPEKNLFYCFAGKVGGDQIALTAHIKSCTTNEAANFLNGSGTSSQNKTKQPATVTAPQAPGAQEKVLQPLQYLEATHPKVQELGISPETATLFGAGYAPKGVLRGRFAIPVRSRDGKLIAYCGIAVEKEQSPRLLFHNFDPHSALFNQERVASSGELYVCRDPLAVLLAVENGIAPESLVSVLTEGIAAQQFEMLSSLMDERQIEQAQLF